ncbi:MULTISPECIES: GtrA family protein [unclassified Curtobacterium]|uniref:GtrA family protein n=1 Tax=unclassified Curtobacterium TaxID=257496 RepID=UPI000DAABB9C|nr:MULTISPECIES: GtrA family protein [unclassified Curtobacterium]PZE22992.1 GtrA family protein [Curtobacterium sp. MCBD17_028]PZE71631.1 GtrA family protein [Curtobacterium sp. MCBD17_019]PZF57920.1 GtrA family protein [Curtobacterium sp. MCBD17_034]PZM33427.1 GtrA family protein [Curtobacterium sp. MCBD17_031]
MTRATTPVQGRPVQGTADVLVEAVTGGVPVVPRSRPHAVRLPPAVRRRPLPSVRRRLPKAAAVRELASFGAVGGVSFVVDVGVYNLLRATVLDDKPVGAKIVSVAVATLVAWLGNRFLTFRSQRTANRRETAREGALFVLSNLIGLGIATGCLFVSHYLLGFTSTLADNVAGNGVGLVLGTIFRFVAYKAVVFRIKEAPVDE